MADKNEVKVEVPPGPLGADAQVQPPETKAELKEVLTNPADAKLHPAPGAESLESEYGAQTNPDRPPFASGHPAELVSGIAGGPGAHTPPDPDVYDAEGRPVKITAEVKK